MATTTLFNIPVAPSAEDPTSSGAVVGTVPAPGVYLLTFSSNPDNRLRTNLCHALLQALDIIEFTQPPGVVVTTSAIPKFYSNGLDLDHAFNTKSFWEESLWKLFKRLLTYPMPTVALLNGHAFAGALMLAMHHDYRIFNPTRGFLCLNELDFGATMRPPMISIFREKIPNPATVRTLVIEAKRFNAKDALEGGIVDGLGGLNEALEFIAQRKLTEKGKSGVYGSLKWEIYRQSIDFLENHEREAKREKKHIEDEERRKKETLERVTKWKNSANAKL
ncbi:ClpP/crotonase-like domain-containing protein [Xylogone sp. PMI_703]|nr:ClpP/crotonase-like domain-containing protein [Xylogone sp. PMI_703]